MRTLVSGVHGVVHGEVHGLVHGAEEDGVAGGASGDRARTDREISHARGSAKSLHQGRTSERSSRMDSPPLQSRDVMLLRAVL